MPTPKFNFDFRSNACERLTFKMAMRLLFFYCFAGGVYMTIELIYRQYTDYHMFYLAGFIGLLILCINELLSYESDFLLQIFLCGTAALIGELACGLIFNADYHIWDYRELPFNFMGHIQLYFAVIWYILSAIFIPVLDYIDYTMFPREGIRKPYYKILGHSFEFPYILKVLKKCLGRPIGRSYFYLKENENSLRRQKK